MDKIKALLYMDFKINFGSILFIFMIWNLGFIWVLLGFAPMLLMGSALQLVLTDTIQKSYALYSIMPYGSENIIISKYVFKFITIAVSSILLLSLSIVPITWNFLEEMTLRNVLIFAGISLFVAGIFTPISIYIKNYFFIIFVGTVSSFLVAVLIVSGRMSFGNVSEIYILMSGVLIFIASIIISIKVYKSADLK